jgi:hypothetical protein
MTLREIKGDLMTYFNWSANALVPITPGAADKFLKENRSTILIIAQKLLELVNYAPGTIYRGIILKQPVNSIVPHKNMEYLSFSTDRSVAEHFADVKGFGSEIIDVAAQLEEYGYIIEYTPKITEILFHHRFLSILPYAEAFSLLGRNGLSQVKRLEWQKEITIFQPAEPLFNITRYHAK